MKINKNYILDYCYTKRTDLTVEFVPEGFIITSPNKTLICMEDGDSLSLSIQSKESYLAKELCSVVDNKQYPELYRELYNFEGEEKCYNVSVSDVKLEDFI